ncbi:MAG: hypothetical protein ACTSVI_16485 [Promethearchaeota archaeon]
MGNNIDEVWIFTKNGEPVVELYNSDILNENLGGFMDAMGAFIDDYIENGDAVKIIGPYSFIITSFPLNHEYYLICKSRGAKKSKIKHLIKGLNDVRNFCYEKMDGVDINQWVTNKSIFDPLIKQIQDYFKH